MKAVVILGHRECRGIERVKKKLNSKTFLRSVVFASTKTI